jgi:hypothetical protein
MRFAVELKGQADVLASVAPCFQGDIIRIVGRGDGWFLESPVFDVCTNGGQVFPIADNILGLIHRICYVYAGLLSPFTIGYVQPFNETGVPLGRSLRASDTINVYSSEGIGQLRNSRGSQTLGAETLRRALGDQEIRVGLDLIGEKDLEWPQVYDILEFLGSETIVENKWVARKDLRRVKRTANHYRHLGRPQKNPLPPDPPSLQESISLVLDLLRKWLGRAAG